MSSKCSAHEISFACRNLWQFSTKNHFWVFWCLTSILIWLEVVDEWENWLRPFDLEILQNPPNIKIRLSMSVYETERWHLQRGHNGRLLAFVDGWPKIQDQMFCSGARSLQRPAYIQANGIHHPHAVRCKAENGFSTGADQSPVSDPQPSANCVHLKGKVKHVVGVYLRYFG